mmetsp:Transcript_56651/g.177401  ORF Transcript_56651/g.177401 Transcript_56651/m.177401 type:complete len:87 (-) Transcript_56651:1042-1302(-)
MLWLCRGDTGPPRLFNSVCGSIAGDGIAAAAAARGRVLRCDCGGEVRLCGGVGPNTGLGPRLAASHRAHGASLRGDRETPLLHITG